MTPLLLAVLACIFAFRQFALIWLATGGGPSQLTETLVVGVYNVAFRDFDFSYGATIGVAGFLTVFLITLVFVFVQRRREAEPVRTASTIKLPIMLAVFDAVARGQAKWEDLLTLTAQQKVTGSGVLGVEFSTGDQLPIRDVLHLMIVLSDNTATNMILERFTADAVNAYLDKIGIKTTRSMRKILGTGPAAGTSAAGRSGAGSSRPSRWLPPAWPCSYSASSSTTS